MEFRRLVRRSRESGIVWGTLAESGTVNEWVGVSGVSLLLSSLQIGFFGVSSCGQTTISFGVSAVTPDLATVNRLESAPPLGVVSGWSKSFYRAMKCAEEYSSSTDADY